jgi:thiol-disulfide isomerase/thioredoxin
MVRLASVLLLSALLYRCGLATSPGSSGSLRCGTWRLEMDLHGQVLPVLFDLQRDSAGHVLVFRNGSERIVVRDVVMARDSIKVRMPLFDSEFKGIIVSDSAFAGYWFNYLKGPDYRIPFSAIAGASERFPVHGSRPSSVNGAWRTVFSPGTMDTYPALGLFHQQAGQVTGTFGTETGDYRFLDGVVADDSLLLSAFDGSHAFLFKAAVRNDSLIGRYWSGVHWQEPWVAVRDDRFHLRDPDSLTFLKEGHDMVDFTFPTIDSGTISPSDQTNAGHVRLVQIMGSWCPNCVDETRLLDELYSQYHDQGLNVMAIAFEKQDDPAKAIQGLRRFRDQLDVKYPIAYAGSVSKENTSVQLPFLDHVMSYPTCIFIDKAGKVRRIRTGFYGPGTGEHYLHYKRNLEDFVAQLLAE